MDERERAAWLADEFPELNPDNFDRDDALLLHEWSLKAYDALRAYAAGQDQSAGRLAEYLTSVGLVRFCHETSAAEYQDGGRLIITALRAYAAGSVTGQSSAHQSTAAQELPTPTSDSAEYPTAAAYEAVCAARTKWQERAERAEAALMHAQKNYAAYSIATAQVESLAATVRQLEAERDALREVRYELESTCLQKDFIAAKVRQLEAELDTKRWFINALNPQVHIDAFHDCYTIVVSHGISVPINSRTGPGVHDFAHHDSTPTLDAAIDAARKEKR